MRRFAASTVVVLVISAVSAVAGRTRIVGLPSDTIATSFGAALANLTDEQRDRFNAGLAEFIRLRSAADGLGPVFNGPDCRQCHHVGDPSRVSTPGGSSDVEVVRIGTVTNGVFDPLNRFGGSVLQGNALGQSDIPNHPFKGEQVPREATFVSRRISPAVFGLGLVDATPDATFVALAEQQSINDPGTAGRAAMVTNLATNTKTVGKFGWKAQVPTLFQFSGDALLNELGVTNPQFPDENCPSGDCAELAFNPVPFLNDDGTAVRIITDFMAMLAPPPRGPITPDVLQGEEVFAQIGCTSCHVPTLTSGTSEISALHHKRYHPYSDFLLHDMGSLGDGIEQESAKGSEFRTAPLWGARGKQLFLHDGSAGTFEEAIRGHDGQGKAARDRFAALSQADRLKLIAFLKSL